MGGDSVAKELRNLMYSYTDRYEKLAREYQDVLDDNDQGAVDTIKALQRQCRIMIAELWEAMVKVGALYEEEIEFGSIKKR